MSAGRPPVTQLVHAITVPATPAFKAACRRGASRLGISLAEYARFALSERLAADGVRHKRPDGPRSD